MPIHPLFFIFFEITHQDIWYLVGASVATLLAVGAIATAVKAIRGEIWSPFQERFLSPRRERKKKVDALFGSVDTLLETTQRIEAELKVNGGHSLKDTVNRIERRTEHISARIRHLDETSPTAIFEMDPHGNWTFVNGALCEIVDADESEMMFKNWLARVKTTDRQRVMAELNAALANKFPFETTTEFCSNDKFCVRVRLKALPHVLSGGELRGFFGTVTPAGE